MSPLLLFGCFLLVAVSIAPSSYCWRLTGCCCYSRIELCAYSRLLHSTVRYRSTYINIDGIERNVYENFGNLLLSRPRIHMHRFGGKMNP